ncbi:MAG TPA: FAD-dependent oxidoreductase [Steroidobacter sp.]|uniref:FAD-dependent oxidoreductase n=1 Tax=Steroidobacter sp. TaxID=1978227 RepID=UPI002ED8368E
MPAYVAKPFPYRTPPELAGVDRGIHPVVIVGAGPIGLAAAIDLALQGVRVIVIDDNDVVSVGSRAICWSKRSLEILDRLGVGDRYVEKGFTWKVGRVHHRDRFLYSFDLLPEGGHKMPAFVNLQQYYAEEYLVDRCADFPDLIDLRWKNEFVALQRHDDHVRIEVQTPDGRYSLSTQWLIAADGARSAVRSALGLKFEGRTFEEKFLIADVRWADAPNERNFWFQPSFDPSESVLIHRQADNISRIDFQIGWDADTTTELQPEKIAERVRRVVGDDVPFELDWCSIYTFRCVRMERFVHGRVIFAGDSAHVVSPFGARGGNGGLQDVDNLCWKLARVIHGQAPRSLLDSYDEERGHGCDENIMHSSRTTRFMTPKTPVERDFRDGVLALAPEFPFARALVNSGRLSKPCSLQGLPYITPDSAPMSGDMVPGSPCDDAPMLDRDGRPRWLLNSLGNEFCVLVFDRDNAAAERYRKILREAGLAARLVLVLPAQVSATDSDALTDQQGLAQERYGGEAGVTYLIRPDQHVAARFPGFDVNAIGRAYARALRGVSS